ncbi:MAG: hypothetical protein AAFQ73_00650 [Pseudomonadota bacterium]
MVENVSALEQLHIWMVRHWLNTPESQQDVWNLLAREYGGAKARKQLSAFEAYLSVLSINAHRPLFYHQAACPCLGSDERHLADLMRHATQGAHEAATLSATKLVKPGVVADVVQRAAQLGHVLSHQAPTLLCRARLCDRRALMQQAITEAPSRLH